MREILFRGILKADNLPHYHKGQWVYGDYVRTVDGKRIIPHIYGCGEIEPGTEGQYTGLKDKNGKKIFEGDIVKADDFICAVKYGKCGGVANADNYGYMGFYLEPFSEATKLHARYGLRNDICYFDNIEIINNIHDNPELLKGE